MQDVKLLAEKQDPFMCDGYKDKFETVATP